MENRKKLPFRKNCEGYFIDSNGKILAKDTQKGFLGFPGGGINPRESEEQAILRETKEETGAIIKNLKKVKMIRFIWEKNWAKNEKQKQRYNHFQGEEMHFFQGEIETIKEPSKKDEDYWEGEKLMEINAAIDFIENTKPFSSEMKEYRETQLHYLQILKNQEK